MENSDKNILVRIFYYFLLFLLSFLVFDSEIIVLVVLFAVFALEYFLKKSNLRNHI
tara:strand:+ start:581 stop:748 length:168 start_codon:yes stop_codon:yes gene_type:complete